MPTQGICNRCKYISSQDLCKACVLLEGLNKGLPKLGVGKSSKVKEQLAVINGEINETNNTRCCSKGGCQRESSSKSTSTGKCCRGGNPSKRQSKKSLAKANLAALKASSPPNQAEINNSIEVENDEYFDFFGCGGGTDLLQSLNIAADNFDGTSSSTKTDMIDDIENLGGFASKKLHISKK